MDLGPASELVHRIGNEIVRGSDYAARPWHTIVVVADFSAGRRLFGYCFWDDGWEAATPDGFDALLMFGELRDAMSSSEPWQKVLCRISRSSATVDMQFDRIGDRWVPEPADPEGFARRLTAPADPVPPGATSIVVELPPIG